VIFQKAEDGTDGCSAGFVEQEAIGSYAYDGEGKGVEVLSFGDL